MTAMKKDPFIIIKEENKHFKLCVKESRKSFSKEFMIVSSLAHTGKLKFQQDPTNFSTVFKF